MNTPPPGLEFEQPIFDLEKKVATLKRKGGDSPETADALRELRRQLAETTRQIYDNLDPWQTVQVARHKDRPHTTNYLSLVFDEFVELHGDRRFGDDPAMLTGMAKLEHHQVMVIGHQKGRTFKERTTCFFGCAHPEGYRKAMLKMQLAAKHGLPVITFIDTPGAYPGLGSEERGVAQAIADNMFQMSRLPTPIICVVIGEGGSGGAIGIGVGDRIAMLQHTYYSVISPEGCAGILWKSHKYAEQAATALKFTSKHLPGLGVVDDVIEEPLGGAHRDHYKMSVRLKMYLLKTLNQLVATPIDELLAARYQKFRRMGKYIDRAVDTKSGGSSDGDATTG